MNYQHRKNKILQLLRERDEVSVRELADQTGASEITIRRDLQILSDEGQIFRTHGGAMRPDIVATPVDFTNKAASRIFEKDYICKIATRYINDGDTLFLDCGSTAFRLSTMIKSLDIRVVTNSIPIVHELMSSRVRVNLVGGELDKERHAIHGQMAIAHISRYKAHKAFIGVDGVSASRGLTAHSELEAEISLAMAGNAMETYLLCDSMKIGRDQYYQFGDLDMIDVLITNELTGEGQEIANKGVKVVYE